MVGTPTPINPAVILGSDKPENDPSNPSSDYIAMSPDWDMITDIRAGSRAVKSKTTKYLPKYEKETDKAYMLRLESTPWRPEFNDALRGICSKPFTKPVKLQGEVPAQIAELAEDIDGQGNDLHSFARDTFQNGVAMGVEAIYVTYPDVDGVLTQADEKASGARPYWVHLSADDILAWYFKLVGGRLVTEHIRFRETRVTRNKFAEDVNECVRVIELPEAPDGSVIGFPVWTLYEKQVDQHTQKVTWIVLASGTLTVPGIPIVPFFTGERSGNYRVKAPMADLAHMQLEIFRALSREDEILTYAGSPMLTGKGMSAPEPAGDLPNVGRDFPNHGVRRVPSTPLSTMTIGPKTILFAPPGIDGAQSEWDFIQPAAANITAVSTNVNDKINHFRRLALQPMMPESGRLTATSSAIDAAKAHSAIECWAMGLKDALEQAIVFTGQWIGIETHAEVAVHTDFGVDIEGFDEYTNLLNLFTAGIMSRETMWQEAERRGILGPQFDADLEAALVDKAAADKAAAELDMADKQAAIVLKHTPAIPGSGVTA